MSDYLVQRVGPINSGVGSPTPFRGDTSGALVVTDGHGRYNEAVFWGGVYGAAPAAGVAVTNLAAVATGFILYNPKGSGVVLSLLEILLFQTSVAAATANAGVSLAAWIDTAQAPPAATTAIQVRNAQIGNAKTGVGQAFSGATFAAAPVTHRALWQPSVSATASAAIPPVIKDDVGGAVMVLPGAAIGLTALSALSVLCSMLWEEFPAP
jgi:hypothetical protein